MHQKIDYFSFITPLTYDKYYIIEFIKIMAMELKYSLNPLNGFTWIINSITFHCKILQKNQNI